MVVDAQGEFVTQRQLPRMVLVRPQLRQFEMVLRAPGMLALHIAFDRSLTVGDATEVLRSNGARIIEGPDSTGIIGVTANMTDAKHPGREMHLLAERLRADPRVRWVEPLP